MEELFHMEKISGLCERVCYFFTINILFIVSNLPVLLFLLFVGAAQIRECLPLFLLCLVPMAPALSSVMYGMNRLIHGVEGGAFHDYKKGYCTDFLQKIGLGAGQMLVVLLCWTNIEFFTGLNMKPIQYLTPNPQSPRTGTSLDKRDSEQD